MADKSTEVLKPGESFRGYRVERLLGKGAMGAVYLVRHELLDTCFALKVLDPEVERTSPAYIQRFVREARIACRLQHPNIVRVHDIGEDRERGFHYFVMDYVEGRGLDELLAANGRLSVEQAVYVVASVAQALVAGAKLGVVHRDIKPGNIMVTDDFWVKLVDFGIAKASSSDTLTMAHTVFGTPAYMSPEQASDTKDVDIRADIWSLGVVLYEMLAGERPYPGEDMHEIMKSLLSPAPFPDIRARHPDVPLKLAGLIGAMCEKDRRQRLATPEELLATLERLGYMSGETEASEQTPAPWWRRIFGSRKRRSA